MNEIEFHTAAYYGFSGVKLKYSKVIYSVRRYLWMGALR